MKKSGYSPLGHGDVNIPNYLDPKRTVGDLLLVSAKKKDKSFVRCLVLD